MGGVTAVQLRLMPLEETAVAVSPAGAEGTAVHEPATVNPIVAVWVTPPPVPVTVTLDVPVAAVLEAVSVSVLLPLAREVGLKLAVTPLGNGLAVSATLLENPPVGVTVTELVPLAPWAIVRLAGLAESVKLGELVGVPVPMMMPRPLVPR